MASNLASASIELKNSLDDQLTSLRHAAQMQREQRIARLTEALSLAESVGLDAPSESGNLITSYSGETAYMRGAHALRNEIALLEQRTNDDPFIPELAEILIQQSLPDTVSVSAREIAVARIDQEAGMSKLSIKPRTKLIMALALVLGGMPGVFLVLIRNMFRGEYGAYQ